MRIESSKRKTDASARLAPVVLSSNLCACALNEARIETTAEAKAEALAKALEDLTGIANASMRMSPENLPSLADTVACLTSRTAKRSAECAKRIIQKYFEPSLTNEVTAKI